MAEVREARVPDIGDFTGIPVIEVLVKAGDRVEKDQGLITLESDKATMEVPAPFGGTVTEIKLKAGDEVSEGDLVALIEASDGGGATTKAERPSGSVKGDAPRSGDDEHEAVTSRAAPSPTADAQTASTPAPAREAPSADDSATAPRQRGTERDNSGNDAGGPRTPPVAFDASAVLPDKVPYASPAVRLFARELGVALEQVGGSGRNGRVTREDVQRHVKSALQGGAVRAPGGGGLDLLPWPKVDFAKFGEVESKSLSRIKKIAGANLARNWAMIPHVTQHDEADITEMEAFRKRLGEESAAGKGGAKLTPLVFLIKAAVAALKAFPHFNASLDGEQLVLKKYFHIGIAVDTPDGLMVPVLRDCDRKGLVELGTELGELSKKAREKKLGPAEMQGGCFSISSLGGIGGTAFTPIVNAPEVAILGVSRSAMKPVWDGTQFVPRLMLPISLSYDHRVVDGADAARFTSHLAGVLGDLRRLLL